ncbi:MAG: hypothetical protein ACRDYV_02620 [Acidimicrobiia bacterium]
MIDDVLETSVPTPPSAPRRTKIAVAAVALVAVLAGGLAVAVSGDTDPEPLALVAGNAQGDSRAEETGAPAAAPMAAGDYDAKMSLSYPGHWGGIEYKVDGDLPDLGDKAVAWRVITPDLDRDDVIRWAEALGVSGTPVLRDGSWTVSSSEANFNAYPGDGWSISYNRMRSETVSGSVSAADAERQARALLDRLGVLEGEWRVETYESEIGIGYACAEDLKLREEELARIDADATVSNAEAPVASAPPSMPSMPSMPDCPPPPPPVKAQGVSFFPVVDGNRVEWGVWSVTVGPEGIENLYGNWVTFEKGDEYKLRSVDAALEELRQGGQVMPMAEPMPMPAVDTPLAPPTDAAIDPAASSISSGGGTSGFAGTSAGSAWAPTPTAVVGAEPAMPVEAVDLPAGDITGDGARPAIAPYPCPPEADCVAPEPQVVTITDVELTLIPNPVYSGRTGAYRMYLVPGYRFRGTFQGGEMWETTVIALHPDAIAPPPAVETTPVKGEGVTTLPMPADMGSGQAPAVGPAPTPERAPAG